MDLQPPGSAATLQASVTDASFDLRSPTPGDMAAVHAIYASYVHTHTATFEEVPPDVDEMRHRHDVLVALGMPYLVALEDTTVVGFAYAAPFRQRSAYRYTVEDSIYVHPDAVGRGVGRCLLAELISRCRALNHRQMVAVIGDSGNAASIRLHHRLGFVPAGTLKEVGFKFGRWIDSVYMQKTLMDETG